MQLNNFSGVTAGKSNDATVLELVEEIILSLPKTMSLDEAGPDTLPSNVRTTLDSLTTFLC